MKRATARDVAELVGCSVASVSLVVNGRAAGRVNDELRDRILAAVKDLHYRPNVAARDLATRSPTTIAILCPDVFNPFFGDVYGGALGALGGTLGIDLRAGTEAVEYSPETVELVQSAAIAGLILVAPSNEVLTTFRPTCPTILVDSPPGETGLATVEIDLAGASRQLADHLVDYGHRRIAYIGANREKPTYGTRQAALSHALASKGANLVVEVVAEFNSAPSGYEAIQASWRSFEAAGVTAVVCADDVLAFGVVAGARDAKLSIPGDFSLASFTDIPYSRLIDPSLTSVTFDGSEVGRVAAETLLSVIRGEHPKSSVLPTELQIRQSTARVG